MSYTWELRWIACLAVAHLGLNVDTNYGTIFEWMWNNARISTLALQVARHLSSSDFGGDGDEGPTVPYAVIGCHNFERHLRLRPRLAMTHQSRGRHLRFCSQFVPMDTLPIAPASAPERQSPGPPPGLSPSGSGRYRIGRYQMRSSDVELTPLADFLHAPSSPATPIAAAEGAPLMLDDFFLDISGDTSGDAPQPAQQKPQHKYQAPAMSAATSHAPPPPPLFMRQQPKGPVPLGSLQAALKSSAPVTQAQPGLGKHAPHAAAAAAPPVSASSATAAAEPLLPVLKPVAAAPAADTQGPVFEGEGYVEVRECQPASI